MLKWITFNSIQFLLWNTTVYMTNSKVEAINSTISINNEINYRVTTKADGTDDSTKDRESSQNRNLNSSWSHALICYWNKRELWFESNVGTHYKSITWKYHHIWGDTFNYNSCHGQNIHALAINMTEVHTKLWIAKTMWV